ncbi:MAG: hypothetical protein LBS10_04680 [Gracilibacteraceae bacterium]|nr:hypothetical protein [Gracilibacteraceae bacterium]
MFCTNLITGKSSQWERSDIAGTLSEERLPDWARNNLDALREPSAKESVLAKIKRDRQGKQAAQSADQQKPKSKKTKKDGPER